MLSLFGLSSCSHCLIGDSPSASGFGFLATSYSFELVPLIPCSVSTNPLFFLVPLTRVHSLMIISIIATLMFVLRHYPYPALSFCSTVLLFCQSSLFLCSAALALSLTVAHGVYVRQFHHRSIMLPMVANLGEECRTQRANACEEKTKRPFYFGNFRFCGFLLWSSTSNSSCSLWSLSSVYLNCQGLS
jgi:hypothetical protein